MTTSWPLLTCKVPPEPAKRRAALWRRLKGIGAVYLQSGVCLLEMIRKLDFYGAPCAPMDLTAMVLVGIK